MKIYLRNKYETVSDIVKSVEVAVSTDVNKRQEEIQKLIRTAFFIAKSGLPFMKYAYICQLQRLNGMELGSNYMSDMACGRFVDEISKNIKDNLRQNFNKCRFVTIMSDGSTDKGILNFPSGGSSQRERLPNTD